MKTFSAIAAIGLGAVLVSAAQVNPAASGEFPPLNDPPIADRLPGKFVWADLFTPDPMLAAKFYQELFGWMPAPIARDGRTYVLLKQGDHAVGGIVQRSLGGPDGARARWLGYVSVADVAQTLALVEASGGRIVAPMREFPRRGTQAIVADRDGAVLGVLRSAAGDPVDYQAETGEWIWAELFVKEPQSAATFYRDVFGYEVTAVPGAELRRRFILTAGGFARAGIAAPAPENAARPAWLGFVRVENAETLATRATSLGGRVLTSPRMSQFGTRFAVIADPAGAAVAVIEFKATTAPVTQP